MRNSALVSWLAAVAMSAMWLTGCGGNTEVADIYAPVPTLEAVVPVDDEELFAARPVAAEPKAYDGESQAELDPALAESVWQDFLDVRNRVLVGAVEEAALNDVAHENVIEIVLADRDANQALVAAEDPAGVVAANSFVRLGDVEVNGSALLFNDCTEEQVRTVNGDVSARFVDRVGVVAPIGDDDTWIVTDMRVQHDGITGDFRGCMPPSFVERALAASDAAMQDIAVVLADPDAAIDDLDGEIAVTTTVSPNISGRLGVELSLMAEAMTERGLERTSTQQYRFEVLGLDNGQPDFTAVIAVCSYYPDGVVEREQASGELITNDAYPPGTSEVDHLYIWIEPARHGEAKAVGIVSGIEKECWS